MPKNICQSRGFALEVAGLGNPDPDRMPVSLAYLPSGEDEPTVALRKEFLLKHEKGEKISPHTIYMTDFTEEEWRDCFCWFELKVAGLDQPLPLSGRVDKSSLNLHRYRGEGELHANIFIPFVPVTGIHSSFVIPSPLVSVDYDSRHCLRSLNPGFLYIFENGKLWREIIVSDEGDLADTPVRSLRDTVLRNDTYPYLKFLHKRNPNNRNTDTRIWLPVRINGEPCKGYRIAYSSVQWTWAYIQWLEQTTPALEVRTQSLDELYDCYSQVGSGDTQPGRFGAGSQLAAGMDRFGIMTRKRGVLLREAIGESDWLVRSAAWKKRVNGPDFELTDTIVGDPHLVHDVDVYAEYAMADQGVLDQCKKEPQGENRIPTFARLHGWGLFYVEDPLHEALFYTQKIQAYAACLEGMTRQMQTPASAALCWKILETIREKPGAWSFWDLINPVPRKELKRLRAMTERSLAGREKIITEEYIKAAKKLAPGNLWNDVLPGSRKALRQAILTMQMELAALMGQGHFYPYPPSLKLPGLEIPGRMKESALTPERFRAVMRDFFTQDGPEYLDAWGIMQEIFAALSIHAATLDPFFVCAPEDKIFLQSCQTGSKAIFGMLEEIPASGSEASYREMLFPKPVRDENPSNALKEAKPDDQNDGDGKCRFNTLRNLLNGYTTANHPDLEAQLAKVCGMGQLVFQLYTSLITGGPARAERGMQHSVNLIRIAPGLEQMVLVSNNHLRDSNYLLLYTVLDPEKAEADAKRVHVFQGQDGNYCICRYLGGESFAFRKKKAMPLDDFPMFLAHLPRESGAGRPLTAAGYATNIVAAGAGAAYDANIAASRFSTRGLEKIKVPSSLGFLNLLSTYITYSNLSAAHVSLSPRSVPGVINLLQAGSAVTTSVLSAHLAKSLFIKNFFLGGKAVQAPRLLSRFSLVLGATIAGLDAYTDYRNEDSLSTAMSIAAGTTFILAIWFGWAILPAAAFTALAWYFRSPKEEVLLYKSLYGKEGKKLPQSPEAIRKHDAESAFAMLQELFPVGKKNAKLEDETFKDGKSHYGYLNDLKDLYKKGGIENTGFPGLLLECKEQERIREIEWPLFSTPANPEQFLCASTSGITLHLEGTPVVVRYDASKWWARKAWLYLEKEPGRKMELFSSVSLR